MKKKIFFNFFTVKKKLKNELQDLYFFKSYFAAIYVSTRKFRCFFFFFSIPVDSEYNNDIRKMYKRILTAATPKASV